MKKTALIFAFLLSIKLFSQTTVVDWSTVVNNTTSGTLNTSNTPNAVVTISGSGFHTLQGASPRWNTGGTNNWAMNGLGLAANWGNVSTTINLDVNFTNPICNNLVFSIHDLNGSTSGVNGAFEDKVTITTYDQNNNIIAVNATNYVWSNSSFCGGQLYFGGAGGSGQRNIVIGRCQNGSYNGNDYGSINSAVTVTISSPTGKIKRVVIAYGCVSSADVNRYYTGSDPGFQNIVISNFTARTAPVLNIATPVCNTNSTSVNLSATASSTSSPTYAWTTTGGTINSGSNGLTPNVKGPGTFTLIAYNGVSTCSTSANITLTNVSCNLLPVELTEFNAGRVNEYVVLNWQTASEINNDYFAIERSLDGTNFQTIDIVKGKGNTHQRVNYQATDNEPGSDITYYRLKQVDLNGKYTYSKIVAVEASEKEIYISQPIPNPFNDEFSISFQLKNKIEFITEIYDLTGKKVRTDYDIFEPGTSHKFFHLKDYENGIYFLNIKSIDGSSSFNYKLIKN